MVLHFWRVAVSNVRRKFDLKKKKKFMKHQLHSPLFQSCEYDFSTSSSKTWCQNLRIWRRQHKQSVDVSSESWAECFLLNGSWARSVWKRIDWTNICPVIIIYTSIIYHKWLIRIISAENPCADHSYCLDDWLMSGPARLTRLLNAACPSTELPVWAGGFWRLPEENQHGHE